MNIRLIDDELIENVSPLSHCTGYRAKELIMKGGDFTSLHQLFVTNPQQFNAVMFQLEGRFTSVEKPDNKPDNLKTTLETDVLKLELVELECADGIDSDEIEIHGEDEEGREGCYTANITEIAHKAIEYMETLEESLQKSESRIKELEDRLLTESKQFDEIRAYTKDGDLACICADHATLIRELLAAKGSE